MTELESAERRRRGFFAYLKRRLDVMGLFGLGGIALVVRALQTIRLYPTSLQRVGGGPAGPRRVVLFIPTLGVGGSQKQLVTFLQHLDRARWDVELVMLDMPDKFFEPDVRALGIPITYLNRHHEFWKTGVVWRLMRHLRAHPCHVLHGWLHDAAALGAIAGRLAGVPVVIGSLRSERPGRFPWDYARWQRGLDVLTAPLHTIIIANSKAVREENRQWAFIPERKLLTIYNGISADESALLNNTELEKLRSGLNLPAGAPLVGIVGRLSPEKDHATFLKAARLVSRARPEVHFLIVGDGNLRQWIESESKRLGLAGSVHVLGNRKDAFALIQLLDVLMLTSTSEGFPNVLLEAAVAGTSVVTTNAGGVDEVVLNGETGFVVRVGDAEAIARRVVELLYDLGLRRRLADAARERVREIFSADQAARAIETCYQQAGRLRRTDRVNGRRLRVCFISYNAYGLLQQSSGIQWGGAEIQVCSLGRELASDPRFEIVLVTGDGLRTGREQYGRLTVVLSSLMGKQVRAATSWLGSMPRGKQWLSEQPASIASAIRSLVRAAYAIRRWFFALSFVRWLVDLRCEYWEMLRWVRLLRFVDADVYVMRCACPQVGDVQRACCLLRREFVYMVAHDYDVSGVFTRTNGEQGKRYERGLKRADAIVCQHGDQVNVVRSRFGLDACLMRSLSPFPVHVPSSACRKTILWIARVDSWKQPDIFIELARRLPEESFVMVAQPSRIEPRNLPRLLAIAAGLPNLCLFEGVPFERTAALFAEAKLFINTSQREGFPNTFLQAAASGTPIVSWAVNPEGFLDRYEIGYCANQDWTRFERFVRMLCADTPLRTQLGENGQRYVQTHHDPAVIASKYADLFFSLRDGGAKGAAGPSPSPICEETPHSVSDAFRGR